MPGDGSPFIKEEQDEFGALPKFGGNMSQYGHFSTGGDFNGVDPSNLTMNSNSFTAGFGMSAPDIKDDDLEALDVDGDQFNSVNGFGDQSFFPNQSGMGMMSGQQDMNPQVFGVSNNQMNVNYSGDQQMYQMQGFNSMPNGFDNRHRKMHSMERHPSDSRSPMTPKTPALSGVHLGTPDSIMSHQAYNQHLHAQAKAAASQWEGASGSGHSWGLESPLSSPHGAHVHHHQIAELINGRNASLPAKMEASSMPATFQTQEAKKKRRRESHNLVERRRRDNINERIQDLSRLVPQHRLEDEKVRKHISSNGPMSPSGISPPQATSLLAGGNGRRAASGGPGNITQGLPMEEKDKGPNKGDILNGAVGWMRDIMWYIHLQHKELEQAKELLESNGIDWPNQESEDEHRMRTELLDSIERNGPETFQYSRGHGSGLRVPKHTTYAGDPLEPILKEEDGFGMDMG
jgi:hypothetical protein